MTAPAAGPPAQDGEYEAVIGLECHVQLRTASKAFTAAATEFGAPPNTLIDAYTLGLPGSLPVLCGRAVELALRLGLACGCRIALRSEFARKNYFYPDLPKGYQISQYDAPLCTGGALSFMLHGQRREVRLIRVHLEEDAGKNLHAADGRASLIDFNRAGVPLCEVVSEPELRSAEEAAEYLRAVRRLVRFLGVSDGNMEEGSLRCDANVSLRRRGTTALGQRTELKNINSFRFIERAIDAEIERQIDLIEGGGRVVQATRLYDPIKNETREMRSKEEANDYRYFPDPDLLPVVISQAQIDAIAAELPELPEARQARFIRDYSLPEYDARVLTGSRDLADFFEDTVKAAGGVAQAKPSANWVMVELLGALGKAEKDITDSPVSPTQLGGMIARIADNTISGKIAKQVFAEMMSGSGQTADQIISEKGLKQETDTGAIEAIIRDVLAANPAMVADVKGGKEKAFNGLVGQVMKASKGKANPAQVNELMKKLLAD